MMDQRLQGWFCSMFFYLWPYYSLYIDPLVVLCSQNLSVITVAIDKFLLCFLFTSSSNSTDGQQTSQQSPPTVEVTPPDSQPEGNGVMEEQTDGERLYFCYNKYPVNSIIHWSQTDQLLHSSVAVFLFVLSISCQDKTETLQKVMRIKLTGDQSLINSKLFNRATLSLLGGNHSWEENHRLILCLSESVLVPLNP